MNKADDTLKILYLEDERQNYLAISDFVEQLGYDLLPQVETLDGVTALLDSEEPKVLLVDLDLRQEDRDKNRVAEYIVELKATKPLLAILVHSADTKIDPEIVAMLLRAGISYLTKVSVERADKLGASIQQARIGGAVYDPQVVKIFDQLVTYEPRSILTDREWEVAYLISARSLSNKEIADCLGLQPSYVAELVGKITRKLRVRRVGIATWYLEQKNQGRVPNAPDCLNQ